MDFDTATICLHPGHKRSHSILCGELGRIAGLAPDHFVVQSGADWGAFDLFSAAAGLMGFHGRAYCTEMSRILPPSLFLKLFTTPRDDSLFWGTFEDGGNTVNQGIHERGR